MYNFERAHITSKCNRIISNLCPEKGYLHYDEAQIINESDPLKRSYNFSEDTLVTHFNGHKSPKQKQGTLSVMTNKSKSFKNKLLKNVQEISSEIDSQSELPKKMLKKLKCEHKLKHPMQSTSKMSFKKSRHLKKKKLNSKALLVVKEPTSICVTNLPGKHVDDDVYSQAKSRLITKSSENGPQDITAGYKYSVIKNISYNSQWTDLKALSITELENVLINVGDIDQTCLQSDSNFCIKELADHKIIDEELNKSDDSTSYTNNTGLEFAPKESENNNKLKETFKCVNSQVSHISMFYSESNCLCILKHPAELFLHGKVKVTALHGSFDVYGYNLENKTCKVYAPYCKHAMSVRTVGRKTKSQNLFQKITDSGYSPTQAEKIITSISEEDHIIILEVLEEHKLSFVENCFKITDLFTKLNKNISDNLLRASNLLQCSLYETRPTRYLDISSSWSKAVEYGSENVSRAIVCGGKGVGKSTFLRYYVNKKLCNGPVLVVDLDPGQAEFTVAGNISATVVTEPLLGPNFTHLKTPAKMLHIGMINVMDNTKRYANGIIELAQYCQMNFSQLPWIINTMGMTNSLGLKLITLIINHLKPTLLLQINYPNVKKNFEIDLTAQQVKEKYYNDARKMFFGTACSPEMFDYAFCKWDAPEILKYSLAPRDERYLNFLAYFGELINEDTKALLEITPYVINWKDISIVLNVNIQEEGTLRVVNGKIVALCHNKNYINKKYSKWGDNCLECYGFGLVRSVDFENEKLYVLTPVHTGVLETVNTLVYSDWTPELLCQDEGLPAGVVIPYRTASQYEQRQLLFAPRRRFNPLQLIRLSNMSKQ